MDQAQLQASIGADQDDWIRVEDLTEGFNTTSLEDDAFEMLTKHIDLEDPFWTGRLQPSNMGEVVLLGDLSGMAGAGLVADYTQQRWVNDYAYPDESRSDLLDADAWLRATGLEAVLEMLANESVDEDIDYATLDEIAEFHGKTGPWEVQLDPLELRRWVAANIDQLGEPTDERVPVVTSAAQAQALGSEVARRLSELLATGELTTGQAFALAHAVGMDRKQINHTIDAAGEQR